jgi:hypothetical protein
VDAFGAGSSLGRVGPVAVVALRAPHYRLGLLVPNVAMGSTAAPALPGGTLSAGVPGRSKRAAANGGGGGRHQAHVGYIFHSACANFDVTSIAYTWDNWQTNAPEVTFRARMTAYARRVYPQKPPCRATGVGSEMGQNRPPPPV